MARQKMTNEGRHGKEARKGQREGERRGEKIHISVRKRCFYNTYMEHYSLSAYLKGDISVSCRLRTSHADGMLAPDLLSILQPHSCPSSQPSSGGCSSSITHESNFPCSVLLTCIWSPERISLHALCPFPSTPDVDSAETQLTYMKDASVNPCLDHPEGYTGHRLQNSILPMGSRSLRDPHILQSLHGRWDSQSSQPGALASNSC